MDTGSQVQTHAKAGVRMARHSSNELLDSGHGLGAGSDPIARAPAAGLRRYIVGTNSLAYPQHRNFLSLPLQNYDFRLTNAKDLFRHVRNRYVARLLRRFPHVFSTLANHYYDFDASGCDLLHFFNHVSIGRTPWVATFETIVPYWGWHSEWLTRTALGFYARKQCRTLIAISERAQQIQTQFLLSRYPEYHDDITAKICVIRPAQELLVSNYSEKRIAEDDVTLTFVGNLFFQKGGMEVLRVFDHLLKRNYPIRLNIVSAMQNAADPKRKTTAEEMEAARTIITRHPQHIRHWGAIPNDQVLALLRETHVALMPTHYDTYGYFVLEAQASACPVITTDAVALPEINSDEVGWVINVDKDAYGTPLYSASAEKQRLRDCIEAGLLQAIEEIVNRPEVIQRKGLKALERIRKDHDPRKVAEQIEAIYGSIVLS
jgi:glycosyltransferase involved in cell wall biosynthesis